MSGTTPQVIVDVLGLTLDRDIVLALVPGVIGLVGIALTLHFTGRREYRRDRARQHAEEQQQLEGRSRIASQEALAVAARIATSIDSIPEHETGPVEIPMDRLFALEVAALQIINRDVRRAVSLAAETLPYADVIAGELAGRNHPWAVQRTLARFSVEILAADLRGESMPSGHSEYIERAEAARAEWFERTFRSVENE